MVKLNKSNYGRTESMMNMTRRKVIATNLEPITIIGRRHGDWTPKLFPMLWSAKCLSVNQVRKPHTTHAARNI